jgi:acetyl esterase/lipase
MMLLRRAQHVVAGIALGNLRKLLRVRVHDHPEARFIPSFVALPPERNAPISPLPMSRLFSLLLLACSAAAIRPISAPSTSARTPRWSRRVRSSTTPNAISPSTSTAPPTPPANAPRSCFFYGGTWRYGQREWYRFVGESLADHGFVVMIPDYRTAPDVAWPAFVEDAARAASFAKTHAAHYGADPSELFLMGHSGRRPHRRDAGHRLRAGSAPSTEAARLPRPDRAWPDPTTSCRSGIRA